MAQHNIEDVREALKNSRLSLGMTMKDLADKVGVSEGTVSRWESGDIENMRRDKIVKLAKALEISPAIIMGWDDPAPSAPASPSLADHEEALLHVYRQLNDEGQEKVRGYTEDLAASGRYIKTGSADMVEEK